MEDWTKVGAAAQIEEVRAKEAIVAAAKAKSKTEEVKKRAAREAATKASEYIMHEGKRIRATPIPDKPYNLQEGKEWAALSSSAFGVSFSGPPPLPWQIVQQAHLQPPSEEQLPVQSPSMHDPALHLSLDDVYTKPLPGTRALGAHVKVKSTRQAQARRIRAAWRSEESDIPSDISRRLPSIVGGSGSRAMSSLSMASCRSDLVALAPDSSPTHHIVPITHSATRSTRHKLSTQEVGDPGDVIGDRPRSRSDATGEIRPDTAASAMSVASSSSRKSRLVSLWVLC